jgi:hypothetical protein
MNWGKIIPPQEVLPPASSPISWLAKNHQISRKKSLRWGKGKYVEGDRNGKNE